MKEIEKFYEECTEKTFETLKIGKEILSMIKLKSKQDVSFDIRTSQVISLFKEILERIDGVGILLSSNSSLNAKIVSRSFLELVFDLRIILDDTSDKTALNYIYFKCGDYIMKLGKYGKPQSDIDAEWTDLENFAKFFSIPCKKATTRQNIKSNKREWYNYDMVNVRTLKENIDEIMYAKFCMETHGQNSIKDNYLTDQGFSLKGLRDSENVGAIFYTIINYLSIVSLLILDEYVNNEEEKNKIKSKLNELKIDGSKLSDKGDVQFKLKF